MEKINVLPNGCWEWTAATTKTGYGRFHRGSRTDRTNRTVSAHRATYELLVGKIRKGLTLDHICHNQDPACNLNAACPHRRCVNPAHLEPVSLKRNILRGKTPAAKNAKQTHCKRGHPLRDMNLFVSRDGKRCCRECMRLRDRRTKANPARQDSLRQYRKGAKRRAYAARYRSEHREECRESSRRHHAEKRAAEGQLPRRKGPSPEAIERRRIADRERQRRKRAERAAG